MKRPVFCAQHANQPLRIQANTSDPLCFGMCELCFGCVFPGQIFKLCLECSAKQQRCVVCAAHLNSPTL